jgi:hypothetical protein
MFLWNVCWLSLGLHGIVSQKTELLSSILLPVNHWTTTVKQTYMLCASKLLSHAPCCFNSATVLDLCDKLTFTQLYSLSYNGMCELHIRMSVHVQCISENGLYKKSKKKILAQISVPCRKTVHPIVNWDSQGQYWTRGELNQHAECSLKRNWMKEELKGNLLHLPRCSVCECKHFMKMAGMCVREWRASDVIWQNFIYNVYMLLVFVNFASILKLHRLDGRSIGLFHLRSVICGKLLRWLHIGLV